MVGTKASFAPLFEAPEDTFPALCAKIILSSDVR